MTALEFIGCSLIGFSPAIAMFTLTIANKPIRIIILIVASFFWLVSILLSSLVSLILVPFRKQLTIGLVTTVLFQELFRYLMYKTVRSAHDPLKQNSSPETIQQANSLAYVSGVAFGIMSGVFALLNEVSYITGPGTMGLQNGSNLFFILSSINTPCFILLHTFWSVIFFNAFDRREFWKLFWVIGSHLFVSLMTLLNQYEMYLICLATNYIVLIITTIIAFQMAGGSFKSLKYSLKFSQA